MFESLKSPEGNLPTLYNLHRFSVVVERASLVKAAKELGVDPSNLKKEIVKLEDSLGFQTGCQPQTPKSARQGLAVGRP